MFLVLEGVSDDIAEVIGAARQVAQYYPLQSIDLLRELVKELDLRSPLRIDTTDRAFLASNESYPDEGAYRDRDSIVADGVRGRTDGVSDSLRTRCRELEKVRLERESDVAREYTTATGKPCWICNKHIGDEPISWWRIKPTTREGPAMDLVHVHVGSCETDLNRRARAGEVLAKSLAREDFWW